MARHTIISPEKVEETRLLYEAAVVPVRDCMDNIGLKRDAFTRWCTRWAGSCGDRPPRAAAMPAMHQMQTRQSPPQRKHRRYRRFPSGR
jgi:hypothetical protein